MKNRIFLGIVGATVFYGLMTVVTPLIGAQEGDFPATPPITAPVSDEGRSTGGVKAMNDDTEVKLDFNAHSGDPVKGMVNYSNSDGDKFKGKVDVCYYQTDNMATFAGTVGKGNVSEQYFRVSVSDNGEGKKADPDMFSVEMMDEMPDCTWTEPTWEVAKGNLKVH